MDTDMSLEEDDGSRMFEPGRGVVLRVVWESREFLCSVLLLNKLLLNMPKMLGVLLYRRRDFSSALYQKVITSKVLDN